MTRSLAILGASGHGKVIADTAMTSGWRKIEFYDDAWPDKHSNERWQIVGCSGALMDALQHIDSVAVGIGRNDARLVRLREMVAKNVSLATIVHPQAAVSRFAEVTPGAVVLAGGVVSVDSRVGLGAIINTGATVDRDCVIGDGAHLCPGAHLASNVTVGEGSFIGIGAVVREGVTIGAQVVVGAGAVVLHDVPDGTTVKGVPAR